MPSTQDFDFENLYGVTEERALNFWASHLQDEMGSARWERIRDSTLTDFSFDFQDLLFRPVAINAAPK